MSVRIARRLVAVFIVLYTVALTYPGMLPFNRIHPLVLGLPFSMAWVALWVVLGIAAFWLLDRAEMRARREE